MNIDCSSMCLLYLIDAFLMTLKRRIALLINETIRSIYSTYQSALQIEYFIKYSMIEWWVEVWMSQSSTLRYEQRFVGSMDWKKKENKYDRFFLSLWPEQFKYHQSSCNRSNIKEDFQSIDTRSTNNLKKSRWTDRVPQWWNLRWFENAIERILTWPLSNIWSFEALLINKHAIESSSIYLGRKIFSCLVRFVQLLLINCLNMQKSREFLLLLLLLSKTKISALVLNCISEPFVFFRNKKKNQASTLAIDFL